MLALCAMHPIELFMSKTIKHRRRVYNAEVILSPRLWKLDPPAIDEIVKRLWELDCFAPDKGKKLKDSHGFFNAGGYNIFWRLTHEPDAASKKGIKRTLDVCLTCEGNPLIPRK